MPQERELHDVMYKTWSFFLAWEAEKNRDK